MRKVFQLGKKVNKLSESRQLIVDKLYVGIGQSAVRSNGCLLKNVELLKAEYQLIDDCYEIPRSRCWTRS